MALLVMNASSDSLYIFIKNDVDYIHVAIRLSIFIICNEY